MMTKIREGYKETEIGVVPEDWDIDLLDNVARRLTGHTPNKKIASYWGGEIPWVSLKDTFRLDKGYVYETTDYTTIDGINNSSAVLLPEGTVIISRDATVGKVGITSTKMATSQHFINYVCGNFLNNKYLYYTLLNRKDEFVRIAIGSTIKTIGMPYFKALKVIVPPLPEQQRIAEILSTTDSHIEKLDKIIEDYQLLKKGMMKKLLTEGIGHTEFKETEIGRIPKEWEVVKLSEITSLITKGTTPSTYGYNFTESGVNFVKVENIFPSGFIDIDSTPKISDECNVKLSRSIILESDILVSIAGTIGRSAIIDKTHLPANTNQALAIIRLKDTLKTDVKYINYTFSSSYFMSYISSIKTVGAQPNMSLKQLNDNLIALPDVEEQRKISLVLNELDNRIRQYEYLRSDFANLKASLMTTLLTGKKRVIIEGEKI